MLLERGGSARLRSPFGRGGAVRRRLGSWGAAFDPRRNSLTLVRFVLAGLVVVSHAPPLGALGEDVSLPNSTLGGVAVSGFFAVSGFLVTESALRYGTGRFLWHRVLRIFPAFWASLVVIGLLLAPLSLVIEGRPVASWSPAASARFVVGNAGLVLHVPDIPPTLADVPSRITSWNGAAWTLVFEFACYLAIGGLVAARASSLRALLAIASVTVVVDVAMRVWPGVGPAVLHGYYVTGALGLMPIFLGGAIVRRLSDRPPLGPGVATGGLVTAAVSFVWVPLPPVVNGVALCVFLLWVSTWLRQPRFFERRDVSYGFYIYAVAAAQLLAVAGVPAHGVVVYAVLTAVLAIGAGWVSWVLVEAPALRLKNATWPRRADRWGRRRGARSAEVTAL